MTRRDAELLEVERDRLREALTWAVGFIRCNLPKTSAEYPSMRNAAELVDGRKGLFNGHFEMAVIRAEVAEEERDRLRGELGRYTDSAGRCDQNRHIADAAVAALGFPDREEVSPSDITAAVETLKAEADLYRRGYDLIGACDISNYLSRCAEAGRVLEG